MTPEGLSHVFRANVQQIGLNVKNWQPLNCSVLFYIDENLDCSSEVCREKHLCVICLQGSCKGQYNFIAFRWQFWRLEICTWMNSSKCTWGYCFRVCGVQALTLCFWFLCTSFLWNNKAWVGRKNGWGDHCVVCWKISKDSVAFQSKGKL